MAAVDSQLATEGFTDTDTRESGARLGVWWKTQAER